MKTKPLELTIEERDTLCSVLEHCMEMNSIANMKLDEFGLGYVWGTPESEQDQNNMKALYDKLKPKRVQKSGWVMKERLPGEVWMNVPHGEEDKFQFITWEEQE